MKMWTVYIRDQIACSMQFDLDLHCPLKVFCVTKKIKCSTQTGSQGTMPMAALILGFPSLCLVGHSKPLLRESPISSRWSLEMGQYYVVHLPSISLLY